MTRGQRRHSHQVGAREAGQPLLPGGALSPPAVSSPAGTRRSACSSGTTALPGSRRQISGMSGSVLRAASRVRPTTGEVAVAGSTCRSVLGVRLGPDGLTVGIGWAAPVRSSDPRVLGFEPCSIPAAFSDGSNTSFSSSFARGPSGYGRLAGPALADPGDDTDDVRGAGQRRSGRPHVPLPGCRGLLARCPAGSPANWPAPSHRGEALLPSRAASRAPAAARTSTWVQRSVSSAPCWCQPAPPGFFQGREGIERAWLLLHQALALLQAAVPDPRTDHEGSGEASTSCRDVRARSGSLRAPSERSRELLTEVTQPLGPESVSRGASSRALRPADGQAETDLRRATAEEWACRCRS